MSEVLKIKEEEGEKKKDSSNAKKRGRRPKDYKEEYQLNRDQTKFFIDLTKDKENLEKIFNLLESANQKEHGREITFKDIALYGIAKISNKDIDKIQESSLSEMEKVKRLLSDYNKKNGTNLDLGEFLVKKLSIS